MPAHSKVALVREHKEPSIGTVEAAKAHFRRTSLLELPEILPPGFELWQVVPMDSRFPLRSIKLLQRKAGIIPKGLIAEIQRAIWQS
jgi:hypothetical protein